MSRLDELVAELCPNGVEYRKLKEITIMQRGTSLTKKNATEGIYPVISGGTEPAFYCDSYNREGETITVAGSGVAAGYVQYWNEPIFVCDAFSIKGKEGNLTKYIYYCLSNIQDKIFATKTGGGIPHVYISCIENFVIPLPPLPVQQEIVRILDNFTAHTTELITELTAELAARRKQYEYYKNMLLTFDDDVPMLPLGDICIIQTGGTPSKAKHEYWHNGTIKWLGSTVCQNQKNVNEVTNYISELGLKNSSAKIMKKGTTLIALVGATIGKVAFLPFEAAINQNIAGIYPIDTSRINPSYVYYACSMLYPKFIGLNQGKLTMANLDFVRGLKIPVPPIKEQERIVSILDRFDKLCNDLTIGLSAEIEARQKQYGYYRDKLLSFKEVSA